MLGSWQGVNGRKKVENPGLQLGFKDTTNVKCLKTKEMSLTRCGKCIYANIAGTAQKHSASYTVHIKNFKMEQHNKTTFRLMCTRKLLDCS